MGHDYGDSVVQELLARDQEGSLPFRIGSVCFLNGALFPEVHNPLFIQKVLRSLRRAGQSWPHAPGV